MIAVLLFSRLKRPGVENTRYTEDSGQESDHCFQESDQCSPSRAAPPTGKSDAGSCYPTGRPGEGWPYSWLCKRCRRTARWQVGEISRAVRRSAFVSAEGLEPLPTSGDEPNALMLGAGDLGQDPGHIVNRRQLSRPWLLT